MRPLRLAIPLALALVASGPAAHAQLLPSVDLGVTGGLNFGSLGDAAGVDLDNATGYHVGVYAEVGVGGLNVRPALLYVRAGNVDATPPCDPGPGVFCTGPAVEPGLSFIAVPVDLKFQFPSPLVQPYALIGPEARFATGDLADADARSVNLALNVGAGADVGAFIGPSVFAELRYAFDVTGFFDDAVFGIPTDQSFKVNLFYVRVGVAI